MTASDPNIVRPRNCCILEGIFGVDRFLTKTGLSEIHLYCHFIDYMNKRYPSHPEVTFIKTSRGVAPPSGALK
ncbi:hypothetical protein Hanom_Chr15g01362341 [Helianthus anomalus]